MTQRKRFDVFLSYSHQDRYAMLYYYERLDKADLNVFVDKENLQMSAPNIGAHLDETIRDSVCFLLLLSPDSPQSDYVNEEIRAAKIHDVPIFVAQIRGTSHDVPFGLRERPYFDLTSPNPETITRLIEEILAKVSRPAQGETGEMEATADADSVIPIPLTADAMAKLIGILEDAEGRVLPLKAGGRASLWWINDETEELYIIGATKKINYEELKQRYHRKRGFVGEVWDEGDFKIDNLKQHIASHHQEWKLSAEEVEISKQISTIVGFPICAPTDPSRITGVVTVDSPYSWAELSDKDRDEERNLRERAERQIELIAEEIQRVRIPHRPLSFQRARNIENILQIARLFPPLEVPIRASLFHVDDRRDYIDLAIYSQRQFEFLDTSLRFDRKQGLVGNVWRKKRKGFDNRVDMSDDDLQDRWGKMTRDQMKTVSRIKSIVAYPLPGKEPDEVIGVFAVSSVVPIDQSDLLRFDDQFDILASLVARLLNSERT